MSHRTTNQLPRLMMGLVVLTLSIFASADTVTIPLSTVSNFSLGNMQCSSAASGYVLGLSFTSGDPTCTGLGGFWDIDSDGHMAWHINWSQTYAPGGSISYNYFDGQNFHLLGGYFTSNSGSKEVWNFTNAQFFRGTFVITSDSLNTYWGSGFINLQGPCVGCGVGSNAFGAMTLETPEPASLLLGASGLGALCLRLRRKKRA